MTREQWASQWRVFRSKRSDLVAALRDRPILRTESVPGAPDWNILASRVVRHARLSAQRRDQQKRTPT